MVRCLPVSHCPLLLAWLGSCWLQTNFLGWVNNCCCPSSIDPSNPASHWLALWLARWLMPIDFSLALDPSYRYHLALHCQTTTLSILWLAWIAIVVLHWPLAPCHTGSHPPVLVGYTATVAIANTGTRLIPVVAYSFGLNFPDHNSLWVTLWLIAAVVTSESTLPLPDPWTSHCLLSGPLAPLLPASLDPIIWVLLTSCFRHCCCHRCQHCYPFPLSLVFGSLHPLTTTTFG